MDKQVETSLKAQVLALLTGDILPNIQDLCSTLEQNEETMEQITRALEEEGQIVRTRKGRFAFPSHLGLVAGVLQGNTRGFAFLLPQDGSQDIYISFPSLHGAMHGDRVLCRVLSGARREAEVVRILKRRYETLIGTFDAAPDGSGYVIPDEARLPFDFYIAKEHTLQAKNRDKVMVKITRYGTPGRQSEGQIVEVLGNESDIGTDILSIIRLHELPEKFSEETIKGLDKIPDHVLPSERERREDYTQKCTFTIDGIDAKDFDDAVSLETLPNGNRLLGVHIADVSHYVKEGTALDRDAYARGTSVYMLDRVLPMLPESLSNGICSLKPNEERLTISCMMELDAQANLVTYQLVPSRICSKARLVYQEVTKALEGEKEAAQSLNAFLPVLNEMQTLAKQLMTKREKQGSLQFDLPEPDIQLNKKGVPISLERAKVGIANEIIEEFMLLANETVASFAYDMALPFCYRVHEEPDPVKIMQLKVLLKNLGIPFRQSRNGLQPMALQQILKKIEGRPEETLLSRLILRSLPKARYAPQRLGHFGLAMQNYCHFTSPIRRYPDLLIHRIIKSVLKGKMDQDTLSRWSAKLEDFCAWCSTRERAAMQAERDVDDLKKAQYMLGHIGENYAGLISNVTGYGLFMELNNTAQAFIPISLLDDDHYEYNEALYCLKGVRRHKVYRLGDPLLVTITRVDMGAHRIECVPAEEN